MGIKQRKVTILDFLTPLHIAYLNQAFDLRMIGKRSKGINLYATNPLTGKNEIVASVSIIINIDTGSDYDYADLQYMVNGKHKSQRIELLAKKAPIGRGYVYYFKCPVTGEQRRKLFLYNGRFVSKQAIENPHYISQIQSRKQRNSTKDIKKLTKHQKTLRLGELPYFKKYYNGFPTKSYLRVLESVNYLNTSW